MALILSNTNIASGETIRASHVTQSIDALTGTKAYDITISGSLTVIGPTNITGSVGISDDLDVVGTLTTGELELTNLTVSGLANISNADISNGNFTGSLLGTASYVTGSNVHGPFGSNSVISSSYSVTASHALNARGPGGNDSEIQFKDSDNFDGSEDFIFIKNSGSLQQGIEVIASGRYSHAEGGYNQANGDFSHAEGINTFSEGAHSHAEGDSTTATGDSSHAEGSGTESIGEFSHAEGRETISSGSYSHAEGENTIAIGVASHAEGLNTLAQEDYSHASGIGTTTNSEGSTVVGKYNSLFKTRPISFEVGTGTSNNNRNTSFKVMSDTQTIVLPVTGSIPTYTGIDGETVLVSNDSIERLYIYLGGVWRGINL